MFNDLNNEQTNPYLNSPSSSYENDSENNLLNNDNSNRELLHNKEENEENQMQKVLENECKKLFSQKKESNELDFDKKLISLKKDGEIEPFNILNKENNENILLDEENENKENNNNYQPITNNNNNNIYIKNDEQKSNKIQSSTSLTTVKENQNYNIQYKKESALKTIKTHILESNLEILNNLIKNHLPKKFKGRSNKIHAANHTLLTSKVSNIDNKRFINMTFHWKKSNN